MDADAPAGVPLTAPFRLQYAYKRSLGPVIGAFMTGLRAGRVLGARTAQGRVLVPARAYDPATGQATGELVEVGPEGELLSFTETPAGAFALVRLDGADTAWLHRLDPCGRALAVGDRVKPRWRPERVGHLDDLEAYVPLGVALPAPQASGATAEAAAVAAGPVTRFRGPTCLDYEVSASKVTAEFIAAILEQRLVGRRCPACDKVYLPPRGVCPTCVVRTGEAVEVGHSGVIETFSVVRIPFEGQVLAPPYVCARIVLDGCDVPLLHIVGDIDPDHVRVGMRVTAVWDPEPRPTLARVRYFRPDDPAPDEVAAAPEGP